MGKSTDLAQTGEMKI